MHKYLPWAAALLAACAAPARDARPSTSVEAPAAKPAPVATPASDLLLQRLRVALGALGNIEKEWPQYGAEDACVLVFAETTQWLLNCPVAPGDDFLPTGQTFLGKPVFSGPSIYEKFKMLVGRTRPLVLKDPKTGAETTRPLFLMQELETLSKHHPAFDAQTTSDEWLAIFVHEYFHGYQFFHPKVKEFLASWKPSETQDNLVPFFKENPEYQEALRKELTVLQEALAQKPDPQAARAALKAWLTLDRARMEQFGPVLEREKPGASLEKVDGFVTFVEGVARYEETRFLLEETLRGPVDLQDDPRFKGFSDFRGLPVTNLPGRNKVTPGTYNYLLGAYVCFLLDAARPTWKQTIMNDPRLLVGEVEAAVAGP